MIYTFEKSNYWKLRSQPHMGFYEGSYELTHLWQIGKIMILKWRKIRVY